MLAGPIFSREALTAPRSLRHFLIRSGYVAALFVLMYTAAQATFGWQDVRSVGDIARFGGLVFQLFSLVQLSLILFFALLFAAGSVAQEKDRQTLILLLMTDLRDRELVMGKLLASLLIVGVLLLVSVPVFALIYMLGGVGLDQIAWSLTLCAAAALAAGSWGALVAFWREKTYQTLAFGVLGLLLFLGVVEAVVALSGVESPIAGAAALFNPYRAMFRILAPLSESTGLDPVRVSALPSVLAMLGLAVAFNAITTWRLRVWNPTRVMEITRKEEDSERLRARSRTVWSNPVIWREIRTRAYGHRVALIKFAYIVLAAFAVAYLLRGEAGTGLILGMVSPIGFAFISLSLVSLMILNAQAVTALTSERDGKTLELLLVTDITAGEFIFGKLGGILYNTKEMLLVPIALAAWFAWSGTVTWEHLLYLAIGYLVLVCFAAMLGLHSGLSYDNSRAAIANSLGTMFFLFIGIFIFIMLLVEAASSFFLQFQSFILFILVGSIALWASLSHRNPSQALAIAAFTLPFITFYALTEFLLGGSLGVCLAIVAAYGFTTIAMLVPAISEFDLAFGRATLEHG